MTQDINKPYKAMDNDKALQILYGEGIRNLTAEGYTEAMRQLRSKDSSMAGRVQRMLRPLLEKKVFPRRQREWYDTSRGAHAQLTFLPRNPHLEADVRLVRDTLRIPSGHVNVEEKDAVWQALVDFVGNESVRRVAEGNLAGAWLHVHRKATLNQPLEEGEVDILSVEMRNSAVASARTDLQSEDVPTWMRRVQVGKALSEERVAPLDWCAVRLVERYRLPKRVAPNLGLYILTQDPDQIAGLELLDVQISYGDSLSGDPEAFSVSLRGVDEFITKKDWDHIWYKYVRPRQTHLWERRGMAPQGRTTVNPGRLARFLPLYRGMVAKGLELSFLIKKPEPTDLPNHYADHENADPETIRRNMTDLARLLSPEQ